jgi:hypothetical protein
LITTQKCIDCFVHANESPQMADFDPLQMFG